MKNWGEAQALGVKVIDSIDEGLNDPIRKINMAMTGEVVAQRYGLKKLNLTITPIVLTKKLMILSKLETIVLSKSL